MSVRCRACHDELLKTCAEIAELKEQRTKLKRDLKLAKSKSRRDRRRHIAACAERDAAVKRAEVAEWFGRE